jgi:peptidoglycan/xylan/chitin deacetylase (PgdA/CDA1 family)
VVSDRAIVSLTFDDATACQRQALALLDERGLRGSFYVGVGFIGRAANRLDWADLTRARDRGHEIGGHSLSHRHLTELSPRLVRKEVLRDRQELNKRGFDALTFAYPYGEHDDFTRGVVSEAGYLAGRAVGGVLEALPPEDPYALRTPHSARSWTGPDDLAAFVRVAEHETGWLMLVFHHICHDEESDYRTRPEDLEAFLDWLLTRDVSVMRVCDVIAAV